MLKKVFLVTVAVGFLSACADRWDVDGARSMTSKGNAFSQALQKEYVALADAERDEYDWRDAAYFVAKAKAAASGQLVQPTTLDERDLDPARAAEAVAMRADLMDALASPAARKMPAIAAKAQAAGFDCYMQEVEENFQPDDIAACKDAFQAAMTLLNAKPVMAEPVVPGPYIVYFKTGSAMLDGAALSVLRTAVDAYKANKSVTVGVYGHTDTVGSADANVLLSQKRAESVATALNKMGVSSAVLDLHAYGETELRVSTDDGQAEPHNRRVEVWMTLRGKK